MGLPDSARVVVLVRDGCHLCEEAVAIVESVCQDLEVPWQTVNVDADPELRARYTDHVPVTFVDGLQHALWFVDAAVLAEALTS